LRADHVDGSRVSGQVAKTTNGLERYISDETMRALPSAAGGITRSFLCLDASFVVHEQTVRSGKQLASEAAEMHSLTLGMDPSSRETHISTAQLLDSKRRPEERIEPLCTPCPRLGIGLRMNELLRRFMSGRTRKNEPCRVLLGQHTNAECSRDVPPVVDSEPMPLATITDFDIRVVEDVDAARVVPGSEQLHRHIKAKVSLHVCLDGAIRIPELVAVTKCIWEQRALLYAASSQASFIGDVGASISAAAANANVATSKKISCADINTLPLLSVWDTYAGGINNVHRQFSQTAYSGAYGPSIDTGITSSGLMGHFYRSDKRGHGNMMLSDETVDLLTSRLSHCHHIEVGEKKYTLTPVQTRGIPHGFTPGVHTVAAYLRKALDRVHTTASDKPGEERDLADSVTVNGVFSLPYSAFSQALRPDVESTADSTLRHCFRDPREISCAVGRSYLPDATSENEAIVTEPLFRRPCQASVGDNPFATSYEYVDSVFNVMNTLYVISQRCGGVDKLHQLITEWHQPPLVDGEHPPLLANPQWAADACVLLFGVVYPVSHKIAESVVPEVYAKACTMLARAQHANTEFDDGGRLYELDGANEPWKNLVASATNLWQKFSGRPSHLCPWTQGVAPMLELIGQKQGSHDLTLEEIAQFRTKINMLCSKTAWLAYSDNGTAPPKSPNPASDCPTMNDVRRPHLDPIFCAQGEQLDIEPRGCLVGLKPFQLRQIYALLMGAHMPGVVVQCVRNEGGLLLRESSLPTILDSNGKKRSPKGIAPTQTESDQSAYGTRKSKVYGADLQIEAWDKNAVIQAPLYCGIDPPMSKEWRQVGEFGDPSWLRAFMLEQKIVHNDEQWAKQQLEKAAASELAKSAL